MKNKSNKKKGFIKNTFGFLFDFKKWTNFEEITNNAKFIANSTRELCRVSDQNGDDSEGQQQKISGIQSFESVVEEYRLTGVEIKKKERFILYYLFSYLLTGIGLLIYLFYLISHDGKLLAVLATLILTVLLLMYALREHLLFMQLRRRKLGCTFKEWLAFLFGGMKNEKRD